MYERNINVLEMFIEKKLGYVETNNIKNNYYDYKDLVKVLDDYINICDEEIKANEAYSSAVSHIQNIQNTTEKLYNQNVKFEYSRNILFSDVNRKVEDIEKCLTKIESALDKNKDAFKILRQNFIEGIINLNEKSRTLKKIVRPKNKIETDYNDSLALIKENYQSINLEDIELTKKFIENPEIFEEELIEKMIKNGKNEKIPFDENSIILASKLGLDIAKKEAENYLFMYEQTGKILHELENDKLKLEARKKHITDVSKKLSFLKSEKEYLVQFLDNERITAIQGETEHSRLMDNCCILLQEDIAQINNLYDLIIKETKRRATNKHYEEFYNKSYLKNIQDNEQDFINKTNNIDYANGTIISPNYWRTDSIKAIYENFDKIVYETYGRKFVVNNNDTDDTNNDDDQKNIENIIEPSEENLVDNTQKLNIDTTLNTSEQSSSHIQKQEKNNKYTIQKQIKQQHPIRFKKIKKINQIVENNDNQPSKSENLLEKDNLSINLAPEFDELEDLESIINQAKASINNTKRKSHIIKKIISNNKGKYAQE